MAEEKDDSQKTEEPTQKKLDDAIKKGDVVKSQEVGTLFVLGAGLASIVLFATWSGKELWLTLQGFIEHPHNFAVDGAALSRLTVEILLAVGGALAFPLLLIALGGLAGQLVQHQPVFTAEKIKPKLSKLSPLAGFKRLFGMQALVNFFKGIAKVAVVGAVLFFVLWPERSMLVTLPHSDPSTLMPLLRSLTVKLLACVCAVVALIAAADFAYQRYERTKRLRMTRQEVRDEAKQSEGDPHVKAKLRQIRMERGRKRMMAAVPDASVVVTNPTHFAVALKYESDTMDAPTCVAKGADAVAFRIRELAKEHDVPIVENPPLARALFDSVELDEPVPPEHYKAVAQVISYVFRLRGMAKGGTGAGPR